MNYSKKVLLIEHLQAIQEARDAWNASIRQDMEQLRGSDGTRSHLGKLDSILSRKDHKNHLNNLVYLLLSLETNDIKVLLDQLK